MKEMVEVLINKKNGKIEINEIGECSFGSTFTFTTKIQGDEVYNGFCCEKDNVQKLFEIFRNKEIKEKTKEIVKLQKEIKRLEKLKLNT